MDDEEPMSQFNLYEILRSGFPQDRSQTAIETDTGRTVSWQQLEEGSARLANLFRSYGIAEDARILIQADKSVEALQVYLGTLQAGYIHLPLNPAYQKDEIAYFMGDARPAIVICAPQCLDWIEPLAKSAGAVACFTLDADGHGTLMEAAAKQSAAAPVAVRQADDIATILYTSGTTGRSKGAMLSHRNLASNARVLKDYWGWQQGDVLIHVLPIFHVHGLFVAINGALLNGSLMLWHAKFDVAKVIECLPRATVFMGVPTLYVRLLADARFNRERVSNMRLFVSGSAPLLIETFREFQERTGLTILERYGMSETVMLTSNPWKGGERRGGTVGLPLPGLTLRVVDADNQAIPAGEIGSIQVKGDNVFQGYWGMPEKTAEEFTANGFFRTGDVGVQSQDGYVTIVGRSKDLIISGGYNVYPAEIEGYLNEMEGVADSAVVGVPHPDFGEVGVALVVPKKGASLDAESLVANLKSRIAGFKVPKRAFVMTELPRNTMGKVQKNLLRDQHANLFTKQS
jgi:malonyl-CoA/methylmalonyl-CoA synthetase